MQQQKSPLLIVKEPFSPISVQKVLKPGKQTTLDSAPVFVCPEPGCIKVIFSENRESEDTHEKSIFLLFSQKIPLSELIQGKIV